MVTAEASIHFGNDLPEYGQPHGYDDLVGDTGVVQVNPLMWLDEIDILLTRMADEVDFSSVTAISGSDQHHSSVSLNKSFEESLANVDASQSLKDQLGNLIDGENSLIWMDSSTSVECLEISSAVGGNDIFCFKSGCIAIERFTSAQIRKFAKTD